MAEVSRSLGQRLQEFKEHKNEFKEGLLGVADQEEPEEKRFSKKPSEGV
jgi:hypothetical protein